MFGLRISKVECNDSHKSPENVFFFLFNVATEHITPFCRTEFLTQQNGGRCTPHVDFPVVKF